jgi:hypothetical protein
MRFRGEGPPSLLDDAGRIRYRRDAVEAWLEDDEDAWLRLPFEDRLRVVRQRLAKLHEKLRDQCGGPHVYVKHRDRKPPWCDACGYSDVGLHRREVNLQ